MQPFSRYTTYQPTPSFTTTCSHAASETIIDLDYPMYGNVTVKCGGRRYKLSTVRKALRFVDEIKAET